MVSAEVTISNPHGLHVRPAARFVAVASEFESSVRIACGAEFVNGKSIMGLMILAARQGARLRIIVDGPDEDAALTALVALIDGELTEG